MKKEKKGKPINFYALLLRDTFEIQPRQLSLVPHLAGMGNALE